MSYTVYQIACKANGKLYVGYTSKTAEVRFQQHILNAKWKRKTALYDAIRRYGPEAFEVSVLAECESHAQACEQERDFINCLGCLLPAGYNMTTGGDGVPLTTEQRERANTKKRGRFTEKQRLAAERRKGQKASEETRKKLSEARKGKAHSEEHIRKRVQAFRKNRAAKLGIPYVDEPIKRHPPRTYKRGGGKRVWTPEARAAERDRALKQWTPEAKEAARERALRQWTPEARQAARDRIKARRAQAADERKIA